MARRRTEEIESKEPVKRTSGRKRRRKTKRLDSVIFVVKIEDWHVTYSFSLDVDRRVTGGPYWEHTSLNVKGRFIKPDKLSGREVDMTILGDRQKVMAVEKPDEANWTPKAVGGLRVNKTDCQFLGSVPFDAVPLLATLLQAGKIEYLVLSGPELYRSESDIQSIRFEKEFVESDWQ